MYVYLWYADMEQGGVSAGASCGVDLVTTKTVSPTGPVEVGDTITFTIEVENLGRQDAEQVSLTDVIPDAFVDGTLVVTPSAGVYDTNTNTWSGFDVARTVTLGNDAQVETLTITGTVAADQAGQTIENTTTAATSAIQPNFDDGGSPRNASGAVVNPGAGGTATPQADVLTASVSVLARPELTIEKSIADVADTNGNGIIGDAGDTITYDFTVTNTGDTSMAGVTITDTKLNLTNVAVTPSDLTTTAPGNVGTLTGQTYVIEVTDVAEGEVENTAETTGIPSATNPDGSV
ncbi:MAG: hypothetical protein AAGL19_11185, partial [Pseudomonadota bacterium]